DLKPPKREIPIDAGVIHRVVWDLEGEGAEIIPKAKVDTGNPTEGPLVPPAEYTVKLTVDGQAQTAKVTLRPDPRVKDDLSPQFQFAVQIRDDFRSEEHTSELQSLAYFVCRPLL